MNSKLSHTMTVGLLLFYSMITHRDILTCLDMHFTHCVFFFSCCRLAPGGKMWSASVWKNISSLSSSSTPILMAVLSPLKIPWNSTAANLTIRPLPMESCKVWPKVQPPNQADIIIKNHEIRCLFSVWTDRGKFTSGQLMTCMCSSVCLFTNV